MVGRFEPICRARLQNISTPSFFSFTEAFGGIFDGLVQGVATSSTRGHIPFGLGLAGSAARLSGVDAQAASEVKAKAASKDRSAILSMMLFPERCRDFYSRGAKQAIWRGKTAELTAS